MITSYYWIEMFEAIGKLKSAAAKCGLHYDELDKVEEDIMKKNPIPQPKKMEV
jgi:hypothetical protein